MRIEVALLLYVSLSACAPSLEIMYEQDDLGGSGGFICGDASEHTYNDSTDRNFIRGCLGLQCGPEAPDSAACKDGSMNRALGSCVSDFFACFAPAGACTAGPSGTATFANGAKIIITQGELDNGGSSLALVPAGATEPCVAQVRSENSGGGIYWAREAD